MKNIPCFHRNSEMHTKHYNKQWELSPTEFGFQYLLYGSYLVLVLGTSTLANIREKNLQKEVRST